jgi:hypothetical protein
MLGFSWFFGGCVVFCGVWFFLVCLIVATGVGVGLQQQHLSFLLSNNKAHTPTNIKNHKKTAKHTLFI